MRIRVTPPAGPGTIERTLGPPSVTTFAWSPAPEADPVVVTVVAAGHARARELAAAFGGHAPVRTPGPLYQVPGAVVLDSPAQVLHPAAHRLLAHLTAPTAVVVGGADDPGVGLALLHAGVGALLPRDVPAAAVPEALATVLAGEAIVPAVVTAELMAALRRR